MSFESLLPDSITIEHYTGSDDYGAAVFGGPVAYHARIEWGAKDVQNQQGEEVVSTARIFLSSILFIDTRSRITLPSGRGTVNPPIIRVVPRTGSKALHHQVIYL